MIPFTGRCCCVLAFAALLIAGAPPAQAQSLRLSPAPEGPSSCKEAEGLARLGGEMMRATNYTKAIEQFETAQNLCPGDDSTALGLIQAYIDARDFAKAEAASKSFLARQPRSEPAQFFLAYSYFMEQKFQYAGQTLQKLLARDSKNPEALKLMGLTLFFYKEYVLAEQSLRAALAIRPNDEETLYYLGRVYYTQNNFQPAIKAFKELIARNPKNYRAYDNLALCYEAVNKIDEADATFSKAEQIASEVNPNDEWPYANHANMLVKNGQADKALTAIGKAIQINPRSARSQYILGKVLVDKNDLAGAAKHLLLSIQFDSSFSKSHYLLGRVYQRMHELDKAQQEFSQFKELSERAEQPGGHASPGRQP
ncbi:MAG TPA: tetratricopeptide repeat protein [Terriglobia bacterium]|nr:tetratricopeptide repeat protein [Terriglobia bacterium]